MKTISKYIGLTLVALIGLTACKKEAGTSKMTVRMKDAPGDFQQVNVEVLQVEVHNGANGWITLPTVPGIYDLLTLQNDVSAVLVNQGELPAGHIDQFRLILGSSNTVMVDSLLYPLATPSAEQSGLKININADFDPNEVYEVLFDFNVQQSIVIKGNGGYSLKPVLKMESIIML